MRQGLLFAGLVKTALGGRAIKWDVARQRCFLLLDAFAIKSSHPRPFAPGNAARMGETRPRVAASRAATDRSEPWFSCAPEG